MINTNTLSLNPTCFSALTNGVNYTLSHPIQGFPKKTNYPLLITAVVVAKFYVAPLSEDIDLK